MWIALSVLALLTFCATDSKPTMARIVYYNCVPENTTKDCHTIISTQNGAYGRSGYWGEIGDSLVVIMVHGLWDATYWIPTKDWIKTRVLGTTSPPRPGRDESP